MLRRALCWLLLSTSLGCAPVGAVCESSLECEKHDGRLVSVTGLYRHVIPPHRDDPPAPTYWIVLDLADGKGPLLGRTWGPGGGRPQREVDLLVGKRVRVRGTYHRTMPRPPDQHGHPVSYLGGPWIEVDAIEAAK